MKLHIVVITNKPKLSEIVGSRLKFGDSLAIIKDDGSLPSSFAEKRNGALKKIESGWVLFVDDDEVVSRELASEILRVLKTTKAEGFYLHRKDVVFGQILNYGEVKDIRVLRLAKKNSGKFTRKVHEIWSIDGKTGTLKNPLYHQKDNFITEFILRIDSYGKLDAESLRMEKKNFSFFKLIFYPPLKFIYNYFLKQGFRDGYPGLFLSFLMSIQSLSVRVFQWESRT